MKRWVGLIAVALITMAAVLETATPPAPPPLPAPSGAVQSSWLKQLGSRILVVAPHPDDEDLGAGGLIHAALRQGDQVWVVVVTHGESSLHAAEFYTHRINPQPLDYTRLGLARRQETLHAMELLGLPADHVVFLGYADGSLQYLWSDQWNCLHTRLSGGDAVRQVPWASDFRPGAPYCGGSVLADLIQLMNTLRPTAVVYPDTSERHPDHWATGAFVQQALGLVSQPPQAWAYVVHEPGWPEPRWADPGLPQVPPSALARLELRWRELPLAPADVRAKADALEQYHTQMVFGDPLLRAFIRNTELFLVPPQYPLPAATDGWSALPQGQTLAMAASENLQLGLRREALTRGRVIRILATSTIGRLEITLAGADAAPKAVWRPADAPDQAMARSYGHTLPGAVYLQLQATARSEGDWRVIRITGLPEAALGGPWFAGALWYTSRAHDWLAPFRWFVP